MNNKLTFIEVLEKISVGDFAEGKCGVYKFLITKLKNGSIVFLDEENRVDVIDTDINKHVLESIWEITDNPKYINYDHAIDLLRDGKKVTMITYDNVEVVIGDIYDFLQLIMNYGIGTIKNSDFKECEMD